MLRPETVRRLASMGMFVLPILVVKIAAVLLGESTQQSVAGLTTSSPADPGAAPAASVKWTSQQLTAARHVDWLKRQPFERSPLLYEEDHGMAPQPIHPEAADPSDGQARLVLQAVMSSERGRTAVINGRPYREGDTVHEINAVVESIDCAARSATLRNRRNNQSMTINVERPR